MRRPGFGRGAAFTWAAGQLEDQGGAEAASRAPRGTLEVLPGFPVNVERARSGEHSIRTERHLRGERVTCAQSRSKRVVLDQRDRVEAAIDARKRQNRMW